MAYLNGNHIPNLLRLRTLVAKFVGTVCAVSAGLPMGPEGPMVHIGACVASAITYMECSKPLARSLATCITIPAATDGTAYTRVHVLCFTRRN
jgi:H+/Cl- antiporter ClcA